MNEIAGLRARNRFTFFATVDFADAGKHVGKGLLLAVMMNAGSRSRRHLEQAPQIADAMAARRSEPGVCAVPASNSAGPTMWIAAEELMASRIRFESVTLKISAAGERAIKLQFSDPPERSFGRRRRRMAGRRLLLVPEQPGLQPVEIDVDDRRRIEGEYL
jgi:hypothetical protein